MFGNDLICGGHLCGDKGTRGVLRRLSSVLIRHNSSDVSPDANETQLTGFPSASNILPPYNFFD